MNSNESPAPEQAITKPRPFLARALDVLLNPTGAFDQIASRPDYLGPLIVVTAGSVALTEVMLAKIGLRTIIRRALEQSGRASHLTTRQLDQQVRLAASAAAVFTHLGAVVGPVIFLALTAGVGLLVLRGIFGARAGFKDTFSVTCYAALPLVIGDLMGIAVILFGNPNRFNPQSPIPTNLGFFLNPASTSRPLYALATSLDLLTFWFIALLALGLARVSRGAVKSTTLFLVFLGIWLVLTLGRVGVATIP
jgi:hypothetical protein